MVECVVEYGCCDCGGDGCECVVVLCCFFGVRVDLLECVWFVVPVG